MPSQSENDTRSVIGWQRNIRRSDLAIYAPKKGKGSNGETFVSPAAAGFPVHFPPCAEVSEDWPDLVRASVRSEGMANSHS